MTVSFKSLVLCALIVGLSLTFVRGASLPSCLMRPPFTTLTPPMRGFVWWEDEEEKTHPCKVPQVNQWARKPAGSFDLLVSAEGPEGSGRYWTIYVGLAPTIGGKPTRGLCLTTTTAGFESLIKPESIVPLEWVQDLDGDGKAEFLLWDSFSQTHESDDLLEPQDSNKVKVPRIGPPHYPSRSELVVWVYTLDAKGTFTLDENLSRSMATKIPIPSSALDQFEKGQCTVGARAQE